MWRFIRRETGEPFFKEMGNIDRYFDLRELVSQKVFMKYAHTAWSFFDPRLMDVMVWLREGVGVPLVCNNWCNGGSLSQRGFRENTCQIVADKTKNGTMYCSAHMRGQAVDLSSGKMTAKDIRKWIRAHIDSCPWPIRLENDKSAPTWVHIDVCNTGAQKLVEFSA